MAKIAMTKLGLTKNNNIETVDFNSQKIEVKQYLPVEEKLEVITNILNSAIDEHNFYNSAKLTIYQTLNLIFAYSNINFTEKQKEDIYKLYDLLQGSGLADLIIGAIPDDEYNFIIGETNEQIKSVYAYKNSAMYILENISENYKDFSFDVNDLYGKISDKESLGLLRDIMAEFQQEAQTD